MSSKRIDGAKVEALRAKLGLSLPGLSRMIDDLIASGVDLEPITHFKIQNIERGFVKDSSYQSVRSLAYALGVPADDLYKENDIEKPSRRPAKRRDPEPTQAAHLVQTDP